MEYCALSKALRFMIASCQKRAARPNEDLWKASDPTVSGSKIETARERTIRERTRGPAYSLWFGKFRDFGRSARSPARTWLWLDCSALHELAGILLQACTALNIRYQSPLCLYCSTLERCQPR